MEIRSMNLLRRKRRRKSDGPGRIRIKLAELLSKELNVEIRPEDIWQNNYPAAKWLDLCRWGVEARTAITGFLTKCPTS
jgi:hypothetical protein